MKLLQYENMSKFKFAHIYQAVLGAIRRARLNRGIAANAPWMCSVCYQTNSNQLGQWMVYHCCKHLPGDLDAYSCLLCGAGNHIKWNVVVHVNFTHEKPMNAVDYVSDNRSELDVELAIVAVQCFGNYS